MDKYCTRKDIYHNITVHIAQQEKNEYTFATWKFDHKRFSIDKGVLHDNKIYDYCG